MKKYVCDVCGYIYDPAVGDPEGKIAAGTAFEKIPNDWVCPMCGASKESFSPACATDRRRRRGVPAPAAGAVRHSTPPDWR